MSLRHVAHIVGLLLVFVSVAMAGTGVVSWIYSDGVTGAFFLSALITLVVGLTAYGFTTVSHDITVREGYAIVTFAWTAMGLFGALPFLLSGTADSVAGAIFESISGFTTTGATIFADVEALPKGILFWRALSHWLGGMGIIVLVIAVLPFLGVGGMQLFRAEVPGPTPERLRPRMTQTAKLLWLVYVGLTGAQILLYMAGGMNAFNAVTQAFATLATGGFSTMNDSLAGFDSAYIEYVTILFMYFAGVNFTLHFYAFSGKPVFWRDTEWRFYSALILAAAVLLATTNLVTGAYAGVSGGIERAVREGLFQAVSITTTTGFVSADFQAWHPFAQVILFVLLFTGGMAGSTGGGVKIMRVLLLIKATAIQLKKHLHPRAILLARVGSRVVREDVLANIVGFVVLYVLLVMAGTLVMGFLGMDLLTALGATVATVGNIGPGLGNVGPTDNYGWMSGSALTVLSFLMIVGRLEIYTVLLLFHPGTWKARRSFK
ncbi:MAG: TrkH family potassium uptake protein [Longimicrobiales bacterium]